MPIELPAGCPPPKDPQEEALARVMSGFDDLARAIIYVGGADKYHRLKRCAEQAANAQRALGAESLRDFADGGPGYAGDGVDFGGIGGPLRIGGFQNQHVADVYREIVGLAKPYIDLLTEQARAKSQAKPDPLEWTDEVERLSSIRHCFVPGSDELKAVDLRIRDLALRGVKRASAQVQVEAVEAQPCPIA